MAKNRNAAYGAPQEEKELVVSVDRRLLIGGGFVLVCIAAVAGGLWYGSRSATPQSAQAPAAAQPAADQAAAAATAQVLQGLAEAQLDPNYTTIIGGENQIQPIATAAAPPAAPLPAESSGGGITIGATITPVSPLQADLLAQGGVPVGVDENRPKADDWSHDVLHGFEDPNVTKPEYAPFHPDQVETPLEGPRLGIVELNHLNSFDFGRVPMTVPAQRELTMVNVGDQDLVVSRIYTGCGCTATKFGDDFLDDSGFLPAPATLKPGERRAFVVEYDPTKENKPGATQKYIQIFSNDDSKAQFDGADPNSHETRFRIVVEPAYDVKADSAGSSGPTAP